MEMEGPGPGIASRVKKRRRVEKRKHVESTDTSAQGQGVEGFETAKSGISTTSASVGQASAGQRLVGVTGDEMAEDDVEECTAHAGGKWRGMGRGRRGDGESSSVAGMPSVATH